MLDQRPHFREQLQTANAWKIQVSRVGNSETSNKPRRQEVGTQRDLHRREEEEGGQWGLSGSAGQKSKAPCVCTALTAQRSRFEVEAK